MARSCINFRWKYNNSNRELYTSIAASDGVWKNCFLYIIYFSHCLSIYVTLAGTGTVGLIWFYPWLSFNNARQSSSHGGILFYIRPIGRKSVTMRLLRFESYLPIYAIHPLTYAFRTILYRRAAWRWMFRIYVEK